VAVSTKYASSSLLRLDAALELPDRAVVVLSVDFQVRHHFVSVMFGTIIAEQSDRSPTGDGLTADDGRMDLTDQE
jgi:hypothetical protein